MNALKKPAIANKLAKRMIEASEAEAEKMGIAISTTVVDETGNLVAFSKMDQAPIKWIENSQNKAYTAISLGKPTHDWYPMNKEELILFHGKIQTARLIVAGGGFPIRVESEIIGGIGVSGGSTEENIRCCEAGLNLTD
ncbi:heme-binding protein [Bacillus sp. B15-48]|uniref:GlcG/HbpS family heme-binding protein n=1 Tax=Bacillus sp. B15-48 TaxID=1548601 RepID=UPI00193EFFEE|nr:heme-binding protein [Bacillus sp. B15-48]MBM4765246.1 heme-binding protein [Bacillus sp. B15-48]